MWKKLSFRRTRPVAAGPPTPFEVACRCGEVQRGWRKPERQILRCPSCGAAVFVLPQSAWPEVEGDLQNIAPPAVERPVESDERIGWKPIAVGSAVLLVFVLVLAIVSYRLRTPSAATALRASIQACYQALRDGSLADANTHIEAGAQLLEGDLSRLPMELVGEYKGLRRKLELVADLIEPSLEEILAEAQSTPAAEWDKKWRQAYRGRSVILMVTMESNSVAGKETLSVDYPLIGKEGPARIALSDFTEEEIAWLRLHLADQGLFGARLASLRPEEPDGVWVLRFQPGTAQRIGADIFFPNVLVRSDKPKFTQTPRPTAPPGDLPQVSPGENASALIGRVGLPYAYLGKQLTRNRSLEWWAYRGQPDFLLLMEKRRGQPLRVAPGKSLQTLPAKGERFP